MKQQPEVDFVSESAVKDEETTVDLLSMLLDQRREILSAMVRNVIASADGTATPMCIIAFTLPEHVVVNDDNRSEVGEE
jgi:hypothetical protein